MYNQILDVHHILQMKLIKIVSLIKQSTNKSKNELHKIDINNKLSH